MSFFKNNMFTIVVDIIIVGFMLALVSTAAIGAEQDYTDRFCETIAGSTKVVFEDRTRPDCINEHYVIEVDWAYKFYEGIGQALYYGTVSGVDPGLVLIVRDQNDQKYVERAAKTFVCPRVKIWTIDKETFEITEVN
jgi:hypothetical protein